MNSYVTCVLMGGLGNQLFQIFATISYAKLNNKTPYFIFSNTVDIGKSRPTYWTSLLRGLLPLVKKNIVPSQHVEVTDKWATKQIPYYANKNVVLNGYFQSTHYFINHFDEIYNMIGFDELKEVYVPSEYKEAVSMHFRFGDYVKLSHLYHLLSHEYYARAIHHILREKECNKIFYFCEDADEDEWVLPIINRLRQQYPSILFGKGGEGMTDWQQMICMSCCQANVIANSTFSWWSAMLNTRPDKIVVYPEKWYQPHTITNTSTMFPTDWIKL